MTKHRINDVAFSHVYPYYIAKAEKKGRTQSEVDELICWLTGYSQKQLVKHLEKNTNFEDFYGKAPMNPVRNLITGVVCGIRVENLTDPFEQSYRYLDKIIDELAKGRPLNKIMRSK